MNKEEYLIALGNRVQEIRIKKGMTQSDLGAQVKKDQQSIQRLEKGNVNPSIFYLIEIAQGLGVSVIELLNFEIKKSKHKREGR